MPEGASPRLWALLKSFWPFFRPYRREITLWFGIYGAYFIAGILTPVAVKIYFDSILPAARIERIWLFVAIYALYAAGQHILYFKGFQGTARIIETVVSDLRAAVYEKLHRLTIRFFDRTLSGEVVNRVTNDTRQIMTLVGGELVNVTLQGSMAVVSMVILLLWNAHLGVVVLAFLPAYAWLFYRFLPMVHRAARSWRRAEDRLWGNWGEKLRGVSLIQAFTRERREELRHHAFGHVASDQWVRMTMAGTRMNVLGNFTANISSHSAYAMGCLLVINGDLRLGELISLSGLIGFILTPVQAIFNLVNTWQQSVVSAQRILKIMGEIEEVSAGEGRRRVGRLTGEVRFEHVHFSYVPGQPVLNDIHLSVPAGTTVALIGHTGCGKSTLVNLLLDFYRPQDGTILIDGIPTGTLHPQDLRRNIGVVPQDVTLFHDTIRANVAYGSQEATDDEIWRALEVAQAAEYVRSLPKVLETRIGGEEGVTPSEGESQRLCMARALVKDPSIVILDEATSSLDSNEEDNLQRAIKELLRGRTAFIIAHRLSTVRNCDLAVVMEHGRIIESGPPSKLLDDPASMYSRLHSAHFSAGGAHA